MKLRPDLEQTPSIFFFVYDVEILKRLEFKISELSLHIANNFNISSFSNFFFTFFLVIDKFHFSSNVHVPY